MAAGLTTEIRALYDRGRHGYGTEKICYAPFVNMYFNSRGNVGPCWLTLDQAPRYPDQTLREIWFGEYFLKLRKSIEKVDLTGNCGVCKKRIVDGVFSQVLARAYDLPYAMGSYPQIMEFELSNLCNLACTMCKGSLSSKIRKVREQLAPLRSPYNDAFVEQLKEFIPHLREARFNGGEPFLQKACWDIWEQIAALNPDILITVATNGTVLNEKVERLLEACRFRINVSLDSLIPKTYESIRVGSSFETVIKNTEYFADYCQRRDTIFSIMVNPMRSNWREMPHFVRWCSERNYHLWFNTVWRPRHLALWTLASQRLSEIQEFYLREQFELTDGGRDFIFEHNVKVFKSLAENQMSAWIEDQEKREAEGVSYSDLLNEIEGAERRFKSQQVYAENAQLFQWIGRKTKNVLSSDMLFHYLNRAPRRELESTLESCKGDALLEWVYQICDYY